MKALVTGASGFIGQKLVKRLVARGDSVICQSRSIQIDKNTPSQSWICHNLVSDSWEAMDLPKLDVIYHLAAQTSTYLAKRNPLMDLEINLLGALKLLEYCRKQESPPFVIFAGTATEIGLNEHLHIDEGQRDNPVTFYDISKLTAERYLLQYARESFIKGCAVRLSNVYGRNAAGQQNDRGILARVYGQVMVGDVVKIYGTGEYIRDYIHIDDVVSALVTCYEKKERINGEYFYIGSGQGITIRDAFNKVADLAASASLNPKNIEHIAPPDGLSPIEFRNAIVDYTAFHEATSWSPMYSFDKGICDVFDGVAV